MTDTTDDDVSYLVPVETTPQKEKVWCKISDKGELEYVDWGMVKDFADQFDNTPPDSRTEHILIAKLMWLVRQETLKEKGHGTD